MATLSETQALTEDEFHHGECLLSHGPRGGERRSVEVWRRNGATQTWKTRPGYRVPVKWGMRSYGQITPDQATEFHVPKECPLEFTEYRARHGNRIVEVSKWGGGTLGKRYGQGEKWDVKVIGRYGSVILDDVLTTGATPQNHREVAEAALGFIAGEED